LAIVTPPEEEAVRDFEGRDRGGEDKDWSKYGVIEGWHWTKASSRLRAERERENIGRDGGWVCIAGQEAGMGEVLVIRDQQEQHGIGCLCINEEVMCV